MANKTDVNFRGKLSVIHDFSVWLRTVSNPADINQFRSHTGKIFLMKKRHFKSILKCPQKSSKTM